jgi:dipeptidyl-peptidase-4
MLLINVETGVSKTVLTETSDTWVDVEEDPVFLENSNRFVRLSQEDGFNHVYLHDLDGRLIARLTKGAWDVESLAGVDEKRGLVYFMAGVETPLDRNLYAVKLDGTGFRRVTVENGSHAVSFSPDFSVYRDSYSDANTPTRTCLHGYDGAMIRIMADGRIGALDEYPVSPKSFFTFRTTDGIELNGWMIRPHDFDPSKKYPVLMSVYGGPGSQTVRNSWGGSDYLWYQMLAQKGYVIVSVDGRGTGMRGRPLKNLVYRSLGKWETNDQVEAARHLSSLPFVDGSRIGIWGWSYGGYMTLMALTSGGGTFRAGVSVAPVTNWKFYDSIYTERYMQTPALNPEGYKESAPAERASDLSGRLLLVHGTADDNVHWQNSVTMVSELIRAGKQFETAFYPGGMHGIGGGKVRAQLFSKITGFLLANL